MRRLSDRLWLLAAGTVMIGVDLGHRVLASNDEARFPLLGQSILAGGPWLIPRLDGEPYLHKPPLVAWLIALVSWPGGHVSQLTAVVPVAVAGLALVFVVYALGHELFGPPVGLLAALIAVTTQGVVHFARIPVPDMVMVACVAGSVWMLIRMTRGARRAWIGFYGLMGLAFWAKGPAGLMPIVLALSWGVVDRRPEAWRAFRLAAGGALLAAIIAPWWLAGLLADAAAVRSTVVTDQLLWYLPQAPTWPALATPARHAVSIALPWTIATPIALVWAVRRVPAGDPARQALTVTLLWGAMTLILVGLSNQQRFRYYLPLVPPIALLVGWWVARVIAARPRAAGVFALAWGLSAAGVLGAYHLEITRQNADYDYPRLSATLKHELGNPDPVATWQIHHLPLAFYLGRPVRSLTDEPSLLRAAAPPAGVIIARDPIAARLREESDMVVLDHERFGGHEISIVGRRM